MKLVAKIEKATALEDLSRILNACDAVDGGARRSGRGAAVRRGPIVQKRLIHESNLHGKPVITGDTDAGIDGAQPPAHAGRGVGRGQRHSRRHDAVMLSAETATGDYPLDAVRAMDRIIREMERHALAKDDRRLAPRGDAPCRWRIRSPSGPARWLACSRRR